MSHVTDEVNFAQQDGVRQDLLTSCLAILFEADTSEMKRSVRKWETHYWQSDGIKLSSRTNRCPPKKTPY